MHSPRAIEEDTAVGRDRRLTVEQVLQRRDTRAIRMLCLRRLGQLLRISQQDQPTRAAGNGNGVRERELTRLIDYEHIHLRGELLARPQPGRAANEAMGAALNRLQYLRIRTGSIDSRSSAMIVLIALLQRRPADCRQQIANDRMGLRRDADRQAVVKQSLDQRGSGRRLARPRRSLHGQHRITQAAPDPNDDVSRLLAGKRLQPRRHHTIEQPLPQRDEAVEDVTRRPLQRLLQLLHNHRSPGSKSARPRRLLLAANLQVEPAGSRIHIDDLADVLVRVDINGSLTNLRVLRRVLVAPHR